MFNTRFSYYIIFIKKFNAFKDMKASGFLKMVFGLLLLVASVYAVVAWWLGSFLTLLKGGVPILVFLVGLVFVLLGFED